MKKIVLTLVFLFLTYGYGICGFKEDSGEMDYLAEESAKRTDEKYRLIEQILINSQKIVSLSNNGFKDEVSLFRIKLYMWQIQMLHKKITLDDYNRLIESEISLMEQHVIQNYYIRRK